MDKEMNDLSEQYAQNPEEFQRSIREELQNPLKRRMLKRALKNRVTRFMLKRNGALAIIEDELAKAERKERS